MCRCLERPQAVSGIFVSAATYNQPFRLSGCFLVCPKGDELEAGSTRLEAVVEEWQLIATSD